MYVFVRKGVCVCPIAPALVTCEPRLAWFVCRLLLRMHTDGARGVCEHCVCLRACVLACVCVRVLVCACWVWQGCPGTVASEGCPSPCQFCDEELYDCENDGSCICKQGYTGPDCAFHCIPKEPKYNFIKVAGGALCDCQNCWEGMYCDIYTCPNDTSTNRELTADEKAAQEYKMYMEQAGSSAASYGVAQWWLHMAMVLLASSLFGIGTGR